MRYSTMTIRSGFLVLVVCVMAGGCMTTRADESIPRQIREADPGSSGFLDENTAWAKIKIGPGGGTVTAEGKKKSARENAIKYSRIMIADSFVALVTEGAYGMFNRDCMLRAYVKKYRTLLDSGKILYERFDAGGMCEMVYVVSSPGLKKDVMASTPDCAQ